MSIISGHGIIRNFGPDIKVLRGVDIEMGHKTFNVLMGPSGSGKTTLMNSLGVLDKPTKGEIYLDGQEVTRLSESKRDYIRRTKLGYIFQSVALINNMTAWENVDFALRICKYSKKERMKRVEECLSYVGLKERMKHYPAEMSGGEQQRVAIARAIAHKPIMLLADEPTAELDTATGLKVVKLFKDLVDQEGLTVLMCTHDLQMKEVADNRFIMQQGLLVEASDVNEG